MLVGDLIVGARELIPDSPRTLIPPTLALSVVAGVPILGGGLTYYIIATATNRWGETLGSSEQSILLPAGGNVIQAAVFIPPGASGINLYYANSTGQQLQFVSFPVASTDWGTTKNLILNPPQLPGTPPVKNTCYNPDSNGAFASAWTLYRWLNEALLTASSIGEGLPDTTGIPTVNGQGQYYARGNWKKLWHVWYKGLPVAWAGSADMYYRNKLSGISFMSIVQQNADRMVMEFQPQPDQTSGSTTLASPVAVGDTNINLASAASFYLTLGVFRIGGPTGEIGVYSSINGTQLTGCSRGMGGTIEQAWPAGTQVDECLLRFNGQRLFTTPFVVGQSLFNVPVPPDWYTPLLDYILNRAKQGEQSPAEYQAKLKEFTGFIKQACKGNDQVSGPRQVGGTSYPGDGYPSAGPFRLIIQ